MAKQKKNMNFNSFDSLKGVENIVNEASEALRDPKRTIKNSSMSEVLSAAIGAGVGGAGSFAALTGLGKR